MTMKLNATFHINCNCKSMLMKKHILCGLLLISAISNIIGQNENKKWYFGQNAGLDFTSGSPVPLTGSAMNTPDNSATISDAAGNILFYSDGVTVWNRLHNVMSNGSGILGSSTGGQPATIVPHPGNPNLYYLFTCDAYAFSNGLRYSIIDMSQQSGLGAVTATKNVQLYTPTTEKVIAVRHCNRRDFWLITHGWNSNQFKVYLIDNNGINTSPVTTSVGTIHTGGTLGYYNSTGQIAVSENGKRIGLTLYTMGVAEFLDFDNSTGVVSNPITISGFPNAWGVEFSTSGNAAYITQWQGSALWQINLLAGNAAAIQASTFLVGTPSGPHSNYKSGYLRRGPDGKIYVAKYTSSFVGVVNSPDVLGAGCNFVDNGLNLGGPLCTVGFDNCTFQYFETPSIVVTGTCQYSFNLTDTTDIVGVNWNFGDPASGPSNNSTLNNTTHNFSSNGTYQVQVILNYGCFADTLMQSVTASGIPNAQFVATIPSCDSSVTISNTSTSANSYLWNFGDSAASIATNPSHTYSGPGTYTVTLVSTNTCGTDTATQVVVIQSVPTSAISAVDTICQGQTIALIASGGNQVQWSGGSNATTFTINVAPQTTTLYIATMSNGSCVGIPDSHTVVVRPAPVVTISGPSNACAYQNITLTANGVGNYQWSGGSNSTSSSISVNPAVTTTYYVTSSDNYCTSAADTFIVAIIPIQSVTVVGPTTICYGQTVTLVANGASSYQWSGGSSDTTSAIQVNPATTTTYYASPGNSACPGIPDTFVVNVVPTPILNVSGNTTICQGQSTTLTATGGASYQWSGGSTDTTASIVVSPVATTTYFVTTSNGTCFSPFDTITVAVIPPPIVTIIGSGPICPGTNITLNAVGNATTYIWSGGVTATGQTISDNPTTATTYYVVGYNLQGCSDTDMVTVLVYDTPTYSILGDDSICSGESTTLSCSGTGTFSWSPSTALNSTSLPSVISTPSSNITYTVQIVDMNGCSGTDSINVVVEACVGIEEQDNTAHLVVSPNPSSGVFNLNFSENNAMHLQVHDVLGNVVHSEIATFDGQNSIAIDLSGLTTGTYFLVAYSNDVQETYMLILTE